jgi:hypothetical protein
LSGLHHFAVSARLGLHWPDLYQRRCDVGTPLEGLAYRTPARNLEQAMALFISEVAIERDCPLELSSCTRACTSVRHVVEFDLNLLERHPLAERVRANSHRRACAERSQKQLERIGSRILAALFLRLVGSKHMMADRDELTVRTTAAFDNLNDPLTHDLSWPRLGFYLLTIAGNASRPEHRPY